jgi:hypothetical protein
LASVCSRHERAFSLTKRPPRSNGRSQPSVRLADDTCGTCMAWLSGGARRPRHLALLRGRLKGYGDAAIVGPVLLAPPFAYASALVFGVPTHFLLTRKGIRRLSSYVGIGSVIGLTCVVVLKLTEAATSWNWTPGHEYALSLARYSGREIEIAMIYAALASVSFWVIAIRK